MMTIGVPWAFLSAATIFSTSPGVVPEERERTAAAWIDLPSAIGSEKGIPTSTMSAPPAMTASDHPGRGRDVRVPAHHVGDQRALAAEPPEDLGDLAHSSSPARFAMIWTSLSPRPDRVTTMLWSIFIVPASLTP